MADADADLLARFGFAVPRRCPIGVETDGPVVSTP